MKISKIGLYILITFTTALFMCACEEEEIPKSSFGQTDITQDGKLLIGEDGEEEDEEDQESRTSGTLSKTAKQLDLEELPSGIKMNPSSSVPAAPNIGRTET